MIDKLFDNTDDKHQDLLRKTIATAIKFESQTFNMTLPIMVLGDFGDDFYFKVEIKADKTLRGWLYNEVHAFAIKIEDFYYLVPANALRTIVHNYCSTKEYSQECKTGVLGRTEEGGIFTYIRREDVLRESMYDVKF